MLGGGRRKWRSIKENIRIAKQEDFTNDVCAALQKEDEVDNTLLTKLLDSAIKETIDSGSPALVYEDD